jgi:hypothetical protein
MLIKNPNVNVLVKKKLCEPCTLICVYWIIIYKRKEIIFKIIT